VLILKVVRAEGSLRSAVDSGRPKAKNLGAGIPTPRVFAYEWQTKGLRDRECVRVASKGLTERRFCALAHDGRELRFATSDRSRFTVLSCKLLVSEGERRGEDRLTAEITECAEGTGDKAPRHRGHGAGLEESRDRKGAADGDGGRGGRGRGGWDATFTAHDSRWGWRGQLVEGTVEVQLN